MESTPSEESNKDGNPCVLGGMDCDDDIPLARLKRSRKQSDCNSSSEDDQPLSTMRPQLHVHPIGQSQDDDSDSQLEYSNSDDDPDFKPGKCEIWGCKEDVWAACEDCESLLCYDHFLEETKTCDDHGSDLKKRKKKVARSKAICALDGEIKKAVEADNGRKVRKETAGNELHEPGHKAVGGRETKENQEVLVEEESHSVEVGGGSVDGGDKEGQAEHACVEKPIPVRGRKRRRDEKSWKKNTQKHLRNSGKPYVSLQGKQVAGRSMKPSCPSSCQLKCSTKINEDERKNIFKEFWNLGDKREQQHFILRHIEECPVSRKRVGASDKRKMTVKYYLYGKESRVKVCRTFFLNTLDLRHDQIYRIIRRLTAPGTLKPNVQGKHGHHVKIDERLVQGVRDHISSFPVVDSHYCRADSIKKYLDPSLSVAAMYRLYYNACNDRGEEYVTEDKYRRVFDSEFNLAFHRPKKDQCDVCIQHKNNAGTITEGSQLLFERHMRNKETARKIKEAAKNDVGPTKTSCAFDLQQILLCPHGQSSSYFYKRRLGVYNLTVYDYSHGDVCCYMWPESEGRRGSNEVATCLYKYLNKQSAKGVKNVHLFSDNCAGQNRNRYVAFALRFACTNLNLNSITHTFLEKGHTETENDSVHATIERKVRHIELFTPQQWFVAVRAARMSKAPYQVLELNSQDFVDFKGMAGSVRNLIVDDESKKIAWSQVRQVICNAEDPEAIQIKTDYDGPSQRIDLNRRKRVSGDSIEASKVKLKKGCGKPGIVDAKKRDLMSLCHSGQIPATYHEFFSALPVGTEVEENQELD